MSSYDAVAPPTARPTRRHGWATRCLLALVRAYRWAAAGRTSPCRYWPSCSTYAQEALEVHGARRGTWLTVRRLSRCHPWGGHGIDLVPPRPAPAGGPVPPAAHPLGASTPDRKAC